MYFIINETCDIADTCFGHVYGGQLFSLHDMTILIAEVGDVDARVFASIDHALEWNRSQG